ncbi:6-phosphogluconolactonase [Alloscardovia sp. HMSC034E08]|uniref:6-phosphogluconolactonase n=1 Tax=Alloscardovia sp. HMSC034E08 TaxID=1739413 RepID=UPI0008AB9809|nr:6-phosphogluconolactonase [Alloscardovia sp. HMSC034E08]OFQ99419.1 6-phosphogluconolactonase [Alloscardovia sp. HMSC034E08]
MSDTSRNILVYNSEDILINTVAARLLLRISDLLTAQDRVDVALTGGTDGIAVLAAAGKSPLTAAIDFSRVHFWWGDERFVPSDDGDRNALQAREAWLNTLIDAGELPESNIHEMPAEKRSAEQVEVASNEDNDAVLAAAAREYQAELERELGEEGALDIALFGVGPDGHFASLFPGREEVRIEDETVKAIGVANSPKMPPLRVSLTVPYIHKTDFVWVFASCERKSEAIARALYEPDNYHVPSSFARGTEETLWMLDKAAAANLA